LGPCESDWAASVYDEAKRFAEATVMAYQRYRSVNTRLGASSTPTGRACSRMTAA